MESEKEILVSISCITYNHAPYIRQCLDGFLMQKTDFAFEVLIHDDCSTDGTTDIIKEYEAKYPNIIKPLYEEENQYQQGKPAGSAVWNYPRAKGKYIALCEGDDYWTDPLKLQKQVDFLEANPEYTMCFARAIVHYEDGSREDKLFSLVEDRDYEGIEFFENWIVATASVLYRKEILSSPLCKEYQANKKIIFGDTPLFLTCAHYGKVRGMSDVVSVYRRHGGGATYSTVVDIKKLKKYHYHILEIHKVFGPTYKNLSVKFFIENHCSFFLESLLSRQIKTRFDFLRESLAVSVFDTIKLLCKMLKIKIKSRLGRMIFTRRKR